MEEKKQQEIQNLIDDKKSFILYLYTPMCGTCQVAGKMVRVVAQLFPDHQWGKSDLNYLPEFALQWEIESVPCLLLFKDGEIKEKLYAFHSVPYLYETIKSIS
jgi:thioredoxin 1